MLKSLLVFSVPFTPETPNLGTFGGVAHPINKFFNFLKKNCFLTVYMQNISKLNYKKYFDIRKNRTLAFQGTESPLLIQHIYCTLIHMHTAST